MTLERKVYRKLLQVPKGKITTYKEIARAIQLKNGQRIVGKIMNKNPYPVIIPCHRVIKSDGKIGGYYWGNKIKQGMLSLEGIKIESGKIKDLEYYIHRF